MIPDDLNCDLGEGEPLRVTRALMASITSANIACGGHAGTLDSMRRAVDLAMQNGVHIGAHPGLPDPSGFGRQARPTTPAVMADLIVRQTAALAVICDKAGAQLHHIKLHGALYHLAESRTALARAAARAVGDFFPRAALIAFAGGRVESEARTIGLDVRPEAFADRNYNNSGQLIRREDPQALVTDPRAILHRLRHLARFGEILSLKGRPLRVHARTLCIHSDSPAAARTARILRAELDKLHSPPDGTGSLLSARQ